MNIVDFFKKIGSWFKSDKAKKAFKLVDEIADVAIPIAQTLAALTPNPADDIALQYAKKYADKFDEWVNAPDDQKGPKLMDMLVAELKGKFPNVPLNIIQTAAQTAVTLIKNQ